LQLIQGSLNYRDARIAGYDAATVIEVIEHMELDRLTAFERVLFEFAKPRIAIVTTPNIEYNVKFENLPPGKLRHPDHRFEWTRIEFQTWANAIADRYKYSVEFQPIGNIDPEVGSPTQMAIFAAPV
jgi:3' terminal RNA ribose 2'-O-methyltransferase Hen1